MRVFTNLEALRAAQPLCVSKFDFVILLTQLELRFDNFRSI